jgi:hypothetical protein
MNAYAGLGVMALWIASIAGAGWAGMSYQEAADTAKTAQIEQAIRDTREAANQGAADAISKIVVRNTTVQGRVETIVRENPVYRDCQHAPDQLRNINEALTGRTGSTGDRSLP